MKSSPSPLQHHLGYWLRQLSNHVSSSFAERLGRYEVSVPQWVVLRVLFDQESLALREIVERVGVDQGALSRMVERLLGRGLVERRENPADRREIAISLTREGRQLVPKLAREADENDQAFFGQLTEVQQMELRKTIQKLLTVHPGGLDGVPMS